IAAPFINAGFTYLSARSASRYEDDGHRSVRLTNIGGGVLGWDVARDYLDDLTPGYVNRGQELLLGPLPPLDGDNGGGDPILAELEIQITGFDMAKRKIYFTVRSVNNVALEETDYKFRLVTSLSADTPKASYTNVSEVDMPLIVTAPSNGNPVAYFFKIPTVPDYFADDNRFFRIKADPLK
ncbi:MAG: hypothetical protein FWG05_02920, partial [Kiritimatiellaeota bacterium]|nr:hypothetical protein [Kiritimatiellota bacterium]